MSLFSHVEAENNLNVLEEANKFYSSHRKSPVKYYEVCGILIK